MKVFVDLDDTLADLRTAWCAAILRELGEHIAPEEITSWDRLADWKYQKLLRAPGFFAGLNVEPGAVDALQAIATAGHEPYILSAAGPWNYADKDAWVHANFRCIGVRNVIFATAKGLLAGPDRVLIDDGMHNLEPWEAAGGLAICYSQPWNAGWKGLRVHNWYEVGHLLAGRATA